MKQLFLLVLVAALSGCVNGYQQVYKPAVAVAGMDSLALLAKGEEPVVVQSNDFVTGYNQALRKGYSLLGTSSFNGQLEPVSHAIDFGKSIGATYIVLSQNFTGTVLINTVESVPVSTTVSTSGTRNVNGKSSDYKESTTTTTEMLVPVTKEQRRFDMSAAYMAKPKTAQKFGVGYQSLTPELRTRLKRNTGILVVIVIENSNIFNANIMEGDVITAVNDVAISSETDAYKVMMEAQPVNGVYRFHLLRNGKAMTIPVKI